MIYFVRHGQTDFNKFGISQGQADTSLNQTGLKEAEILAEKLKGYKFDVVFCSPLIRARQTLEAILKHHKITPIYDERLKECSRGSLQCQKNTQEVYDDFFKNPHKYGAESKEDVFERAKSFIKDLQQYKGKNVLIVGHGEFLRHFLHVFEGAYDRGEELPMYGQENFKVIPNCAVIEAEF